MALENLSDLPGLEPLQEDPSGNQKAQVLHPAAEPVEPAGRVAGEVEHLPNDSGNLRRKHIWILFITLAKRYKDKLWQIYPSLIHCRLYQIAWWFDLEMSVSRVKTLL